MLLVVVVVVLFFLVELLSGSWPEVMTHSIVGLVITLYARADHVWANYIGR